MSKWNLDWQLREQGKLNGDERVCTGQSNEMEFDIYPFPIADPHLIGVWIGTNSGQF